MPFSRNSWIAMPPATHRGAVRRAEKGAAAAYIYLVTVAHMSCKVRNEMGEECREDYCNR